MTSTTSPSIIEPLVKRAQRLYSLPAVAMKVVELTGQPGTDATKLRDCIEQDPALTAKVLRVVNSSMFAPLDRVGDLGQAIALLGIKPLKLLVLGFSLPDELLSGLAAEVITRYWRHALIKATAARQISEQFLDAPGDDGFLAGMLQDIGMLVLIQELGDPYVQFLEGVSREGADMVTVETSTLGFDHALLSARLLKDWRLPETLVAAVSTPHDETKILGLAESERLLPQTLHLAELVTRMLISERPELLDEILDIGGLYCDLTMRQLESLIASLDEQVPQLAEILALNLPGSVTYSSVLLSAYQQLTKIAEDTTATILQNHSPDRQRQAVDLRKCVERFVGQPMYGSETPGIADSSSEPAEYDAAAEVDPGFEAHVAVAVAAARQARSSLTLLLVELDDYPTQLLTRGVPGAERAVMRLRSVIERTHAGDGKLVIVSDVRFAILLPNHERHPAVELARRLVHNVRQWSLEDARRGHTAVSVSAGLATLSLPPKNFPAAELIAAAQRCLSSAQLSGGDGVKSIDMC